MKQMLEKIPFLKKKKKGPFAPQIKKAKKTVRGLKIKLFLLYTLPVFIVALVKAVITEYGKIKTRESAMHVQADLTTDAKETNLASESLNP